MSNKSIKQIINLGQDEADRVDAYDKSSAFYLQVIHDAEESGSAPDLEMTNEPETIKAFLQQVHQVTDQFFHSDTTNSLKKAISLGFNGGQFAHYLLDNSSCDQGPLIASSDDKSTHLGTPMWDAMREFESEIPDNIRLTDGIRFVCHLRDLFGEWSQHALFSS